MSSINPINAQNGPADKTDLVMDNWLFRQLPGQTHPYLYLMRLDRPIGTWLLLLPAWWSIALALSEGGSVFYAIWMGILFGIGAVVMRGAGCIVNDLWDRDFDAMVTRTRTRPLVAGTVTARQAYMFLAGLCFIGLLIVTQMNIAVFLLAILSIPFIIIYPVMKRVTWWPQFFLGLTFNFGALMGWAAMTGEVGLPAVLLYTAGIFWTLGYDTIYAHMDRTDDAMIGVKSTARLFGTRTKPIIAGFYGLALFFLIWAIYEAAACLALLPGGVAIAAAFAYQVKALDIDNPALCLRLFKFNRNQGLVILGAIILCVALN